MSEHNRTCDYLQLVAGNRRAGAPGRPCKSCAVAPFFCFAWQSGLMVQMHCANGGFSVACNARVELSIFAPRIPSCGTHDTVTHDGDALHGAGRSNPNIYRLNPPRRSEHTGVRHTLRAWNELHLTMPPATRALGRVVGGGMPSVPLLLRWRNRERCIARQLAWHQP